MTHDSDAPLPEDDAGDTPRDASADAYVQRLIDGDLAPHEESEALHAIADDADARSTLRFELQWSPDAARSAGSPPPQFADNVMAAIQDKASSKAGAKSKAGAETSGETTVFDHMAGWLKSLGAPIDLRVRPLPALLIMMGMLVGVWGLRGAVDATSTRTDGAPIAEQAAGERSSAETTRVASRSGETVWIRFVYTGDDAESVAVAGDFSKWEPIPLSSRTVNGQIIWTGLVPVRRGEHEYQFVINGERWVTDPLAPIQRNDGFGATNAVLKL